MLHRQSREATLAGVNLRTEKHGDGTVPAADLKFEMELTTADLAELGVDPAGFGGFTNTKGPDTLGVHFVHVALPALEDDGEDDAFDAAKVPFKRPALSVERIGNAKPPKPKAPPSDEPQEPLPGLEKPPEPEAPPPGPEYSATLAFTVPVPCDKATPYHALHACVGSTVTLDVVALDGLQDEIRAFFDDYGVDQALLIDHLGQIAIEDRRAKLVSAVVAEFTIGCDLEELFRQVLNVQEAEAKADFAAEMAEEQRQREADARMHRPGDVEAMVYEGGEAAAEPELDPAEVERLMPIAYDVIEEMVTEGLDPSPFALALAVTRQDQPDADFATVEATLAAARALAGVASLKEVQARLEPAEG